MDEDAIPSAPVNKPHTGPVAIQYFSEGLCAVYGEFTEAPSPCPTSHTSALKYKYNCTNPAFNEWDKDVNAKVIASDAEWKNCVGASDHAGGTAFNPNSMLPSYAVMPVTQVEHVALALKRDLSDSAQRVRVFSRADPLASWGVEYTSGQRQLPGGVPSYAYVARDAWMPKIAAYKYPGDPDGYVMVGYNTTFWDASNTNVGYGGNNWVDGTTPAPVVERLFTTGTSPGYSVEASLGRYNGMVGLSHYVGGFAHGWGDQAKDYTRVFASRSTF